MRERYQPKPTSTAWTQVNPGDTGEMIQAAERLGAALDLMDEAFWFPCSFYPDGSFGGMHASDIAKPHCIVVGKDGRRFVNEAISHMELGQKMYDAGAVPAWAIFDNNHRQKYTWGMIPPVVTPKRATESGYLKTGATLDALGVACGIDRLALDATVMRFNGFARKGVDEDFHRGESVYQRKAGDGRVKPNPCLGEIKDGPFFAVALWPADVGTCGGIVTDELARALRPDGTVIHGLYACGNSSATVMGRTYPGGGVSIGPSMTFGYIAARNAARMNQ
jgi:3-oxosteroid 1-dehydrogenase